MPCLLLLGLMVSPHAQADVPNPIQIENLLPGTDAWKLTNPALQREIEGYASATSVSRGEPITLYVSTAAPSYDLEIFRMGYYGGLGARKMTEFEALGATGHLQPTPTMDPQFGTFDCAWGFGHSAPTQDWTSGFFLARLTARAPGPPPSPLDGKQSYIVFVVRDDARASDFVFQSSVTTYQAYNNWPGASGVGGLPCPHPYPPHGRRVERQVALPVE